MQDTKKTINGTKSFDHRGSIFKAIFKTAIINIGVKHATKGLQTHVFSKIIKCSTRQAIVSSLLNPMKLQYLVRLSLSVQILLFGSLDTIGVQIPGIHQPQFFLTMLFLNNENSPPVCRKSSPSLTFQSSENAQGAVCQITHSYVKYIM